MLEESCRLAQSKIKFRHNGVVITKNDGSPLGTRILGPVILEVRNKGCLEIVSLARGTV